MTLTHAQADFTPFVKAQIALIHQMHEDNISSDEVKKIAHQQEAIYVEAFERLLLNKSHFLNAGTQYQKELFLLHKLLEHNKEKGKKAAVLRDEVQIKSYQISQTLNRMYQHILRSLDLYKYNDFVKNLNDEFVKNQDRITKIDNVDYRPFLKLSKENENLKEAQQNIRDYYALLELNSDQLPYLSIYEKRMYRLNKYAQYRILPVALYLDHSSWGSRINKILYPYNLSVFKLFLMLTISLFLYLLRTQIYKLIERSISKIKFVQNYIPEIMSNTHKSIKLLFIALNLNVIIHIYNNFYTPEFLSKMFNIVYAVLFTYILYVILNSIANVRIQNISRSGQNIKSEMVNVGIKIINFLIFIMGILLVMHFAGANPATVLSGLGIGGFAIAIAARESLSNFFGTISILMSDIFSQGDWIVVDGKEGNVVEIGLRVTTLRTFDNALISIPNGIIANSDVKNWSRRSLGRRIKMSLGVKYDSSPEKLKKAIHEIREMLVNHPDIATDKTSFDSDRRRINKLVSKEDSLGVKRTLFVYLDELSDSSINILVYCFTKKTVWGQWLPVKEDVIFRIMDILRDNDLEFAFPSLSLYQESEKKSL